MSSFFVITGPPCSGKTTFAREHSKQMHQPTILDLDVIHQELGSPVTHGHGRALLAKALAKRTAAVLDWKRGHLGPLYYISCDPSVDELQHFPAQVDYFHMKTSREECHRRAKADGRPMMTHRWIDEWFRKNG